LSTIPRIKRFGPFGNTNPGNCLDIGASGGKLRIELTACEKETWLNIQDGSGNLFPLSFFVGSSGVLLGRWM
jgi:hypothetical protein